MANVSECHMQVGSVTWHCGRAVVRDGKCVLHAPKLSAREKESLSPTAARSEGDFEQRFMDELKNYIEKTSRSGASYSFRGVHFTDVQWNQPPFHALLLSRRLGF